MEVVVERPRWCVCGEGEEGGEGTREGCFPFLDPQSAPPAAPSSSRFVEVEEV